MEVALQVSFDQNCDLRQTNLRLNILLGYVVLWLYQHDV